MHCVRRELVCDVLAEHRRREWTERFAVFPPQVASFLHGRRARITQDGAGVERARAEFNAPLEPAQAFLRDKGVGRLRDHGGIVNVAKRRSGRSQPPLYLALPELRTEVGATRAIESPIRRARLLLVEAVGTSCQ